MQIVVDGLLTHYEISGKGPAVLLLHGWGDTLATFHDLQKSLEKRFMVIIPDLPGFGQTQPPAAVWGLDDYAKFVQQFIVKVREKPVVIIGHSNGGAIAVRGLATGTLHAKRLILLASAGIRGEYKGRVAALRVVTKAGKALTKPLPTSIKDRLRRKVYESVGSDMLVAEHLQETFKKVVTDDVREDAAKLTMPTLLLYGNEDRATPLAYGEMLQQRIKRSLLEEIAPAGHFVHHDQPEQVARYILEFLR